MKLNKAKQQDRKVFLMIPGKGSGQVWRRVAFKLFSKEEDGIVVWHPLLALKRLTALLLYKRLSGVHVQGGFQRVSSEWGEGLVLF